MDNKTKKILIDKINELRLAEFSNGLANGIQHHEEAIRNNLKASKIFDEISDLIYSNYIQING